jgi:hypothetical protein
LRERMEDVDGVYKLVDNLNSSLQLGLSDCVTCDN